jgi:hypothetical protein
MLSKVHHKISVSFRPAQNFENFYFAVAKVAKVNIAVT